MYLKFLFVLMISIEYYILIIFGVVLYFVMIDFVYFFNCNLWIGWEKKVGRIFRFVVVFFVRKCRIFCYGKFYYVFLVEYNSDIRSEGKL